MNQDTLPLFARARGFSSRTALLAPEGALTYGELLARSAVAAGALLAGRDDLSEARVAFLTPPGLDYVTAQWGIWRAGGVAVPLCTQHPAPELAYVLDDAGASIVLAHPEYEGLLRPLAQARGIRFLGTEDLLAGILPAALPALSPARRAMILYTSGTTSRPKGVVTTHEMLAAQITSLVEAWGWTAEDRILHVLPLHHLHGILNLLCCALWSGALCEFLPKFDATAVWDRIAARRGLTLFMAVPTIYARLIAAWEGADARTQEARRAGCLRLRLMVSGSAALPVATLEKWRQISGHTLLERYGMTEIGMALSNPLAGERLPGWVGSPLPRVEARLVDERGQEVPDGTAGQIQIRGPNVFREYWGRPQATAAAFTEDGWFKTGDVAIREQGRFRILGRESIDIIKTGGYKVSALEIEEVLRTHGEIRDCAVVGVEDPEWGQRVGAAVVLKGGAGLDLESLRAWARARLAVYKIPTLLKVVADLPRNAMGKVVKPEVVRFWASGEVGG